MADDTEEETPEEENQSVASEPQQSIDPMNATTDELLQSTPPSLPQGPGFSIPGMAGSGQATTKNPGPGFPGMQQPWVPTQRVVESGPQLPPGAINDAQGVSTALQEAYKNKAEADSDLYKEQAKTRHDQNLKQAEYDKQMQDAYARQQAQTAADLANMQKANDAYKNAHVGGEKEYWQNKGVASQIGSALAVGLGAFGSALTHSPNYAQQIIDKSVDRWIQNQKEDLAQKRETVNLENNLYAQHRMAGMSETQSILAMKMAAHEQAAGQAQELAYNAASPQATAAANILISKEQQAAQDYRVKLQLATGDRVKEVDQRAGMQDPNMMFDYMGNPIGAVHDPEQKKTLQKATDAVGPLKREATSVFNRLSKGGWQTGGELDAYIESAARRMYPLYRQAQGEGARYSEDEFQGFRKILGDANALRTRSGTSKEMLQLFNESLDQKYNDLIRSRGLKTTPYAATLKTGSGEAPIVNDNQKAAQEYLDKVKQQGAQVGSP